VNNPTEMCTHVLFGLAQFRAYKIAAPLKVQCLLKLIGGWHDGMDADDT
jgi:hypothetical protein